MASLDAIRADFELRANRSLSLPIAGLLVWSVIAALGLALPPKQSVLALVWGTGAIFPVALLIARIRCEELIFNKNQLAGLMGACVLMANLLWALHIPLLVNAPRFVPLSVGMGLGLHWVVYSWIVRHPVGYIHAVTRTLGLLCAWVLVPTNPVTACALVICAVYGLSLYLMASREIPAISDADREVAMSVSCQ
ncbi:MAG TPA: hypothetical protein VHW25_19185 [Steroidobacteraceae bacterium]|jgi:hypothetical protein|nr:hypothetical protein [Steroidobacteraceae bacterium]